MCWMARGRKDYPPLAALLCPCFVPTRPVDPLRTRPVDPLLTCAPSSLPLLTCPELPLLPCPELSLLTRPVDPGENII